MQQDDARRITGIGNTIGAAFAAAAGAVTVGLRVSTEGGKVDTGEHKAD